MADPFVVVAYGPNTYFLGGELDLETAPILEDGVRPSVESGGPIVLDLSAVSFVDSTGLRAFVRIAHGLGDRGCVILHAPRERVRRVIEMVRLSDLGHIHLDACGVVAYPERYVEWVPPDDLDERFRLLREYERQAR
jgi:anti-sigma B factor antagonist